MYSRALLSLRLGSQRSRESRTKLLDLGDLEMALRPGAGIEWKEVTVGRARLQSALVRGDKDWGAVHQDFSRSSIG